MRRGDVVGYQARSVDGTGGEVGCGPGEVDGRVECGGVCGGDFVRERADGRQETVEVVGQRWVVRELGIAVLPVREVV